MKVFPVVFLLVASLEIISAKHAIACENDFVTMECETDETLEIGESNYGRTSAEICANGGPILTTDCKLQGTTEILNAACGNRGLCSVPANNQKFGDPCSGTVKYLEVNYKCIYNRQEAYDKEINSYQKEIKTLKAHIMELKAKNELLQHKIDHTYCK